MAAGLGFKDFTTGEVLTAADVDGYLMQGIWVFASAAARDAAVTSPQEGNFAFTKDNNSLWYYDGAAWVASGATGDIEGVTAGVGISGGGTSGTVTVTNSMATAIDAKGDLIVGTGADTFSKLTVGTNGYLLTADSAEATGLKWAAAAGGSSKVVQIVTGSTTTQTITTSTSLVDTTLSATITPTSASNKVLVFLTQNGIGKTAANINSSIEIALFRGSTNIQMVQTRVLEEDHAANTFIGGNANTVYLDSPATTSATTYKTQFRNSGGVANQVLVQTSSSTSTLCLMEVTP
jgi:hypothetical protein